MPIWTSAATLFDNRGISVRKMQGSLVIDAGTTAGIDNITIYDSFGKVVGSYRNITGRRSVSVNATGVFYVDIRPTGNTGAIRRKIATLR